MPPTELRDIAAGFVSTTLDDKGNEVINISEAEVSLSPHHGNQFDELVGKLSLPKKPPVKRLSKRGALSIKAKDLVAVIKACQEQNIELDNPA
jgi:hypothetical protein